MTFGSTFLRHPWRFPLPDDGEPWGERLLMLHLPGGPYAVSGLSPAQEASVASAFAGFLAPPAGGREPAGGPAAARGRPVAVGLRRAAAGDFLARDVRGWEYALDSDHAPAAVCLAGLGIMGRLDWQPALGGMLWTPEDGGALFPGVFENFLRVLAAYRLLELGGVILHSAGVVRGGGAYLFLGRSGAGKSTVARLSLERGAEVLSDDLNALLPAAAGAAGPAACLVHKLPFTGDLGGRSAARPAVPLAALVRLAQDTRDRCRPLSRAEALACLLTCAPFVNADPHRRGRLETVLLELLGLPAGRAPAAFELRFSLAGGFWSILDGNHEHH
jgi:hypothetical protein